MMLKPATPEQINTVRQQIIDWHISKSNMQGHNHVHAITEYVLNQQGLTMESRCST